MSNFNNYSRFFKEVHTIPFTFCGETFKVKDSHQNLLKIGTLNKITHELGVKKNQLKYRLDTEDLTEEEVKEIKAEMTLIDFESSDAMQTCIENILGEEQAERLADVDLSTEGYRALITIIFGLVGGSSHKDIMKRLEKDENEGNEGEQETPKKSTQHQNYNKNKNKKNNKKR